MPLPLKRTLSQSTIVDDQYDEIDHARYTRMRILMKDGAYEDELQILRASGDPELLARISELENENRELKAKVHELEEDIEFIINTEMDDVAKLKEDVNDYYKQACKAELQVMEMEEVVSKIRAGKCDPGYAPRKTTQESEIGALRSELEKLKTVLETISSRSYPSQVQSLNYPMSTNIIAANSSEPSSAELPSAASTTVIAVSPFDSASTELPVPTSVIAANTSNTTSLELPVPTSTTIAAESPAIELLASTAVIAAADSSTAVISANPSNAAVTGTEAAADKYSDVASGLNFAYPPDAPPSGWFFEAFHYLQADLGPQFSALVCLWVSFERKNGWRNPHKLAGFAADKTPEVLLAWRKNSRRPFPRVDQSGLCTPEFAAEVWTWWATLQPQWRSVDYAGKPSPFEDFGGDMSSLEKHGRNGWLCLLICVKWWGVGLHTVPAEKQGPSNQGLARHNRRHDEDATKDYSCNSIEWAIV